MASAAVGAVSAVTVAASPASSGLAPPFGSKELHSSVSVLSFNYRTAGRSGAVRATARNGAATRAMQSRVSLAGLQTALISIGAARRVRVFAADGPQIAQPEAEAGPKVTKSAGSGEKSTFDIVCEVISEQLAVNLNELEANTKFVDLGADSLDTVEIMMNLEERFDITIEEDGTEKIATVKDAADLIDMVLKNK